MQTLWLKFPDEVLFSSGYSEAEKKALEDTFSASDPQSAWSRALRMLSLRNPEPPASLIKWHRNAPYFNWSYLAATISGGAMHPVRKDDGSYGFKASYQIASLARLIGNQWAMTRFLQASERHENGLETSIALGLAMQSLVMRMGPKAPRLAEWLALPSAAPASYRNIVSQIQSIQLRRTGMSYVWKDIVGVRADNGDTLEPLPDFFWDDSAVSISKNNTINASPDGPWKGIAVRAGTVTGLAFAMAADTDIEALLALKREFNAPLILVFRFARPQTVEFFSSADAVLFCEGGTLSHACTVAREMNIPCITGLGGDFFKYFSGTQKKWLTIDGATGSVFSLPES